ncbi:MAG TPA: hypothetical protein VII70_11275 [Steroidobacteraceae bacterium]
MTAIDPFELSAYLDNELAPGRKHEIEIALSMNALLGSEFSALATADAAWRAAARTAAFVPKVRLTRRASLPQSWFAFSAALALLIAVRILPKLSDVLALGFLLHAVALVTCLIWINQMVEDRGALRD